MQKNGCRLNERSRAVPLRKLRAAPSWSHRPAGSSGWRRQTTSSRTTATWRGYAPRSRPCISAMCNYRRRANRVRDALADKYERAGRVYFCLVLGNTSGSTVAWTNRLLSERAADAFHFARARTATACEHCYRSIFNMQAPSAVISYEFPLNERIRTLLRMESLYERVQFFSSMEHALDHHAAVLSFFEILDVAGRADLKSELMQELERQKQALSALRSNPQISEEA